MKTSSCSGNKSVSLCKGTWHITVKEYIALQFSWYFEILKQHSSVVRLLCVYTPNPFNWHSNIYDLIDLFERHANSYKHRKNREVEKSMSMHSHVFKQSYKHQVVTDTKSHNASHLFLAFKIYFLVAIIFP